MSKKTETLGTPSASSADHHGDSQSKQALTAEKAGPGHQRAAPFMQAAPASASGLDLHPLEVYAGIVQHRGTLVHLILMPADVNKALVHLDLQRKSESGYVLTGAGAKHGESRPFQAKNKHVGDQMNWYESVVGAIARGIAPQHPLFGNEQ